MMHNKFSTKALLTAFLFSSALLTTQSITQAAQAENENLRHTSPIINVDSQPVHAMLFKNGYGLVSVQADLKTVKDQIQGNPATPITFQTDLFPNATQGSFWLSWSKDISLSDVKSTYASFIDNQIAAEIPELIRASKGKTIRAKIAQSQDESVWVTAEVLEVPEQYQPIPEPRPLILPPPRYSNMAYLKIDGKISAVNMYQIQQVELVDADSIPTVAHTQNKPALQFTTHLTENAPVATVQATYLANGISWNPSYVVDITDMTDSNKEGRISAKAVVVNDLIDMTNVSAELIAGYPHIQYQDASSAMSLKPLREILNQIRATGEGGRMMKQSAFANQRYRGAMMEMAADMPMSTMPGTAVKGEAVEDLYFYKLDNINLKKGERGYFPLFAGDIPASSIYTWDIPDYVDQYNNYRMPNPDMKQTVWHSLDLTNTTDQPWTTASAITMKDGRILGQDTINYTPVKGEARLKITQALSITAEAKEVEISRQRQAKQVDRRVYDIVTIEGTLELTNYKSDAAKLELTKLVSGNVETATDKPETTKLPTGIGRVNSQTQLKWTVDLKPGADNKMTIKYKYAYLTNGQNVKGNMNIQSMQMRRK
ncbi:hypothetical protein JD969_16625 [Planctomycetota bacterium]|nr:hypothetical protein JD969_16625 [Planctomycetota bacterium]